MNKKAFTLIEVLIAILIFALGLTSIFMLINSSIKANSFNKNQIIAANLAREEIELLRNIRDSNYKVFKKWNFINPALDNWFDDSNNYFQTGSYYKIENDFDSHATFPIKVEKISDFWEWKTELDWKMLDYRLCIDSNWIYTYNCTDPHNKKTRFYRYLKLETLKNKDWVIKDAFKVISTVIWYDRWWYHKKSIKTILADWKRL